MFTGIIESTGSIVASRAVPGGRRFIIDVGETASQCKPGDSISMNGVCLTVASISGRHLEFDVIPETLRKTTFSSNRPGDRVNIERALRVGDRMDGHFVQGHVDGTAIVVRIDRAASGYVVWFKPQAHLVEFIIPKGSVAVDGVSLTIAHVHGDEVSVALIPTTLERTNLGRLREGDMVNIESDIITRTVIHHLRDARPQGVLSLSSLQGAGF